MSASLVRPLPSSKIAPPTVKNVMQRDRLFAALDAAPAVMLVIAPAGSGKSTLLATWMQRPRKRGGVQPVFVWYSMDQTDRDPSRLVDGIAAACEHALPGAGAQVRSALAEGVDPFAAVTMLLALLERRENRIVLILDDCQHLDGSRGTEDLLEYLVGNRIAQLQLILASRSIPMLPAVSLAASGQLQAVGRGDLDFAPAEAQNLLTARGVPAESIGELVRTAHGWALGLLLLAQAQTGALPLRSQPQEAIAEYLITQIVEHLPQALRTFLAESALLREFSAGTANQILERPDSEQHMAAVLRRGLFADTFTSYEGKILRYHDVFAEALCGWLQRTDPDRVAAIHRRAAAFFQDDPPRALEHIAAIGDPAHLSEHMERIAPQLREHGQWETLLHFGQQVPPEQLSLLVQRMLSYAYHMRGDYRDAIALARQVQERATATGDSTSFYSGLVLQANPLIAQERYAEALELCLPAVAEARERGDMRAEGWLAAQSAETLLYAGDIEHGMEMAHAALRMQRNAATSSGDRVTLGYLYYTLACVLCDVGHGSQAASYLEEALRIATTVQETNLESLCESIRAELLLLRGEDGATLALAETVGRQAREHGQLVSCRIAILAMARALGRLGRIDEGLEALARHRALLEPHQRKLLARNLVLQTRLYLAAGDTENASKALDGAIALDLAPRTKGLVLLERGALLLAEGSFRRANLILQEAIALLETHALHPALARALILQAATLLALEKPLKAKPYLAKAGTLALGSYWIESLPRDVEPAIGALRAISSHWRLQGPARDLVDLLLESAQPRLRLVPASPGAPNSPVRTAGRSAARGHIAIAAPPSATAPVPESRRFSPFGEGSISHEQRRIPLRRLHGTKAREVLAFAVWQARPLTRDEILEAVWDGAVDERTLGLFRTASYQIRRVLGEDAWQRIDDSYALVGQIDDDYRRLLALAANLDGVALPPDEAIALAREALALAPDDYLPWCYSPWVESPRALARTAVLTAIEALAGAHTQLDQPIAALACAEQGLAIDPAHQRLRESQIALLHQLGRTADALESYRRYQELLDEEGLTPPASLRALIARVRRG